MNGVQAPNDTVPCCFCYATYTTPPFPPLHPPLHELLTRLPVSASLEERIVALGPHAITALTSFSQRQG
jgi:hypothetical protein